MHPREKKSAAGPPLEPAALRERGQCFFVTGELVAGTDGPGQAGIIAAILGMPERLAAENPLGEDIELFLGTGRAQGRAKFVDGLGTKILVVPVFENRFEDIFDVRHGGYLSPPLQNSKYREWVYRCLLKKSLIQVAR